MIREKTRYKWLGSTLHCDFAEIVGTLSLKASDELSKLWPSLGVLVGYATAFTHMAMSLKKQGVGIGNVYFLSFQEEIICPAVGYC